MKRPAAALAALLLLFPAAPAAGETFLTVGNPTPMRGEFFTDLWGNSTSDIDVRDLLHGCDLVKWDAENAVFVPDPVTVREYTVTENGEGDHVWTLSLNDEMCFSDGSPITSRDYAFSFLFSMAPELKELGAEPLRAEHIAGYEAYAAGTAPLSGIRIPDEHTFIVTLSREYLPFYYEAGLLACRPYPISVIAPGVEVRDDGEGVYLANTDDTLTEPLFTAELLWDTVMDEETGYLSHPSVVSGPYVLTGWDGMTAEFDINPYYMGGGEGYVPSIDHVTYTLADNETMMDELADGAFGLLNKVTRTDTVDIGMAMAEEMGFGMTEYLRTGLSYIAFSCERPTVSSPSVRRAIAYCMDRDAVTDSYVGDHGRCVDGWYGVGQWMTAVASGAMLPPAGGDGTAEPFGDVSLDGLTHYAVDIGKAVSLLEEDGWFPNAEGLREKDGVVLDLELIYPEGSSIGDALEANLAANLLEAGIGLTMYPVPMTDLLSLWYRQEEREADMIYLASNFSAVFDPSVLFAPGGERAYTGLEDEELYRAALDMRMTEPGDVHAYLLSWVRFQERFNAILPMLPVYSNYYYDFYSPALRDYLIGENMTWSRAIVRARIAEE